MTTEALCGDICQSELSKNEPALKSGPSPAPNIRLPIIYHNLKSCQGLAVMLVILVIAVIVVMLGLGWLLVML